MKAAVTVTVEGDPVSAAAVLKNIAAYLSVSGVSIRIEDPKNENFNMPYQDIDRMKEKVFVTLRKK